MTRLNISLCLCCWSVRDDARMSPRTSMLPIIIKDSPPDDSDSAAVDLTLGLVDVGDSLESAQM